MKKTCLILIVSLLLASCSKKSNENPETGVNVSGQLYPTVVIGTQTWTAINYNGPGGSNYNDTTVNNPSYGKFYTFGEVKAINLPAGWRIPTDNDFKTLFTSLGAKNGDPSQLALPYVYCMIAKTTWKEGVGTNCSGLNLLATGMYASFSGGIVYFNQGYSAGIWGMDSSSNSTNPICMGIDYVIAPQPTPAVFIRTDLTSYDKYSIRFVKDN